MESQIRFLEEIEKKIPNNLNFIKELSSVLDLTESSIRKKRQGISSLSMEELATLSHLYDVSIDRILNPGLYNRRLGYFPIDISSAQGYYEYMAMMYNKLINMQQEESVWEICSDLPPPFAMYLYPEASVFLFYIDMMKKKKEGLDFEDFLIELRGMGVFEIYKEIYEHYLNRDSKEIYSCQAFSYLTEAMAKEIDSELFITHKTASLILNQLQMLVVTLKSWINRGQKNRGKYQLFLSEEMIGNNIILCRTDKGSGVCFTAVKGHGVKFIHDNNVKESTSDFMNGLRQMYSCMCSIGEVKRTRIFKRFFMAIEKTREKLNANNV